MANPLAQTSTNQTDFSSGTSFPSATSLGPLGVASPSAAAVNEEGTFWASRAGGEHCNSTPPDFNSAAACSLFPANENLDQLLPGVEGYSSLVSEGGSYFSSDGASFTPSLLDFRASALDWLDFYVPDLALSDADLLASSTQNAIPPLNGAALPPLEHRQAVQPWPFDQTQDLVPHRYQLPPLRIVLQGAFKSHTNGWNGIPEGLLQLLSEPFLPHQDSLEHVNLLSAFNLLKGLVDTYFTRFHPIQPVRHIPTWTLASCPTVLLAAMACIGAMFSDDPSGVELSESLSKLCIPMITWLVREDYASAYYDGPI